MGSSCAGTGAGGQRRIFDGGNSWRATNPSAEWSASSHRHGADA